MVTLFVVGCGGSGRTPLLVYSPHGRDLLTLAETRFEALRPDVDVRWLDMGSQEVLDRVRSERANPQGDVWFGGPAEIFARAAEESLLAAYRPTWAERIPVEGRGPGDFYFAAYRTPAVIVYNERAVPANQAPQDWDDVLHPRWKGQVLIRDPLPSGTMRAIFGMIVERSIRETGDTARAWNWLRRLDAQTKEYVFNPSILSNKIDRQEGLITLWDLPDILLSRDKGQAVGYTFPRSGTPVIQDAIALVRGARHGEVARAFIEWVGSVDAQVEAARVGYRLPARRGLNPRSLPDWVPQVQEQLVPAEVDWDQLRRFGADWMRYWDQHVRGSGERGEGRGTAQ
jgi:iron(III) transport system substrate-binding protein